MGHKGKSMKNTLYVQQHGKRHLLGWYQTCSLSHYQVTRVWRHQLVNQSVSQSVENSIKYIFLKFCSNFLKVFGVDLKACLGLVYLTNTAPWSSKKIVTDFRYIYFLVRPHGLLCPYCDPLLWFMICTNTCTTILLSELYINEINT